MASIRLLFTFLATLFLLALLNLPLRTTASSSIRKQHHFKRTDALPPVEFAAAPDAQPVLVKPLYNQFAHAPPHLHHHHDRDHGKKHENKEERGKKKLLRWMHKLGLRVSEAQTDRLYGWIAKDKVENSKHHHHHHPEGHEKAKQEHQHGEQAEQEAGPAWVQVSPKDSGGEAKKPVRGVGILPPGTPRGWGDEMLPPAPATRNSSPAAAAMAPLPEPANSIPAPTTAHDSSASGDSKPRPGEGLALPGQRNDTVAPVTSAPSSSSSLSSSEARASGTSGSLNPSSTPPPPPTPASPASSASSSSSSSSSSPLQNTTSSSPAGGGDPRLDPITSNTTHSIAGIPVASDTADGDMKVPPPQLTNSTSPSKAASKSDAVRSNSNRKELGVGRGGWMQSAVVAAVVVVVIVMYAV